MFNIPTQRLAKVTVTETTTAVTLSVNPIVIAALSFTPRHLLVRTDSKSAGAEQDIYIQFNGDAGSNYNYQRVLGVGTTASAERINGAVSQKFSSSPVSTDANQFTSGEMLIPDALSTRSHKATISFTGLVEDRVYAYAGRWADTAAITSVTLTQNSLAFAAGSIFELCVVDETYNIDQDGDGEQILGSDGTFTVGSISAADGDLVCIGNWRSDRASINRDTVEFEFNSDATDANYARQNLSGGGTSASAGSNADRTLTGLPASTAATSVFGGMVAQITNYSDGSNDRMMTTLGGAHHASSDSTVQVGSERWNNTAAITSVDFNPVTGTNFIAGSMLSTYAVPKNLIERIEITGDSEGSKTFSSIPQTYDHLELSIYARTDRANTVDDMFVYFNSDTTAGNYYSQRLTGQSTTVGAAQYSNAPWLTTIAAANATANEFSAGTITVYNYTKTDRHKHHLSALGTPVRTGFNSNRWASTAAITSITLDPVSGSNFLTGTVLELRGIHSTVAAATSDVEALNGIAPADIEAVN